MTSRPVARWPLFTYTLPAAATAAVMPPITAILPSLYAKHAAVGLTAIGTVFLLMRILDAVSDPLIGYLSDQTRTRWGSRKPWIIGGALIEAVSVYFLFRIPLDAGVMYFGAWSALYYLGATLVQIPHMAWGRELTADYQERARVFGWRGMAITIGGVLYTLVPLAMFYVGVVKTTEFAPEVFHFMGSAALVVFPLIVTIAAWVTPVGDNVVVTPGTRVRTMYAHIFNNPLLLRVLGAYLISGAGSGIYAALIFPFLDGQLGVADRIPHLLLAVMLAQLIAVPFWVRMVAVLGKHRCWSWGWIANAVVMLPLIFAGPLAEARPFALVLLMLYAFTGGVSLVAPFALLADVADHEMLRHRVDRTGTYFAGVLFVTKATAAMGGMAFIFLGAVFGYQISEGVGNTEFANRGMLLTFVLGPAIFQLLAVPLIWNFPIDQRRHDIIRRRLAQRAAREQLTPD